MRKAVIGLLAAGILGILGLTVLYSVKLFHFDLSAPAVDADDPSMHRLVLISQQLESPFWTKVEQGALEAAKEHGVSLEVWGSYGMNEEDFLKKIKIAIASKVDGIIVQGLDTDEFTSLTFQATSKGIPVITVANDVSIEDSLRRTYVGSNHFEAGELIAKALLSDMGSSGHVVLMVSDRQEEYQRLRLNGVLEVLNAYPEVKTEIAAVGDKREEVVQLTNALLNTYPSTKAFIAVTADHASVIIQEITKRTRLEGYYIYSFDDNPEALKLLDHRLIDALIIQSPAQMGRESVERMLQWLRNERLPLNLKGYYTDIQVMRAGERP
jgi:ribose transport system substrate-binding protein